MVIGDIIYSRGEAIIIGIVVGFWRKYSLDISWNCLFEIIWKKQAISKGAVAVVAIPFW